MVLHRAFFVHHHPMIAWLDADAPAFPPTHLALGADSQAPGLLAASDALELPTLQLAYRHGIFPWYGPDQPVMWWSPDPRMVLPVQDFKLSHSLRKSIQKLRRDHRLEIRIDHDFKAIIGHCAHTNRRDQAGTWIVADMQTAYLQWHLNGLAHQHQTHQAPPSQPHSVEVWLDGALAGGLYGVHVGQMFYGESMFTLITDASKMALAALVCFCRAHHIRVIDCQQQTSHLASLGANPWSRDRFEAHLAETVDLPPPRTWAYHDDMWHTLIAPHQP